MKKLYLHFRRKGAKKCPFIIGNNLFPQLKKILDRDFKKYRLIIITDHHVKKAIGNALAITLKNSGREVLLLSFPAGEKSKNASTKEMLETKMLQQHYGRDSLILALGGGVVGDIAGFVAATYHRGIPYIQLPTTLLAMVDSSIGGKTGINTAQGKNLIGALWQPHAILADLTYLKMLPQQHWLQGLAEVCKIFLTSSSKDFYFLQKCFDALMAGDLILLKKIIIAAVKLKIAIVQKDEKENQERMILNFGHTIGHAFEKILHYRIPHGTAVLIGILVESKISELLGLLSQKEYTIIHDFISRFTMEGPSLRGISFSQMLTATKSDKKSQGGVARYVLLKRIGKTQCRKKEYAHRIADPIVEDAFQYCLPDLITIQNKIF